MNENATRRSERQPFRESVGTRSRPPHANTEGTYHSKTAECKGTFVARVDIVQHMAVRPWPAIRPYVRHVSTRDSLTMVSTSVD
eukprot:50620-Eustigmatos_ZCMA.PRE.1